MDEATREYMAEMRLSYVLLNWRDNFEHTTATLQDIAKTLIKILKEEFGYRLIDLDKLEVIDEGEKLGCSLVSPYPFFLIKNVIDEACEHQLDDIKRQLGGL